MPARSFSVSTGDRLEAVDITAPVRDTLPADTDGTVTVFSHHTTAALTVNEADDRLLDDIESFLSNLVLDEGWAHDDIDDNAESHLRAALLGPSETIPVRDGTLGLGTWQSILLVECDGPRTRTVTVTG